MRHSYSGILSIVVNKFVKVPARKQRVKHFSLAELTVVYKHHNNTIRLTIQHKAALTTCVYR